MSDSRYFFTNKIGLDWMIFIPDWEQSISSLWIPVIKNRWKSPHDSKKKKITAPAHFHSIHWHSGQSAQIYILIYIFSLPSIDILPLALRAPINFNRNPRMTCCIQELANSHEYLKLENLRFATIRICQNRINVFVFNRMDYYWPTYWEKRTKTRCAMRINWMWCLRLCHESGSIHIGFILFFVHARSSAQFAEGN